MNQKFHFLITSEHGKTSSFAASRDTVFMVFGLFAFLLLISGAVNFVTAKVFNENYRLKKKVNGLERHLMAIELSNKQISDQLAVREITFREQLALLEADVENTIKQHEQEKEMLLSGAVSELHKRRELIENVLDAVGVDIDIQESNRNSGGPFASLPSESYEDEMFLADYYLEAIAPLPLGLPVDGTITSKYGKRIDPFNGKEAFHPGVDIRNKIGTPVQATAPGKVKDCGYLRGYGRFVLLQHDDGFSTLFSHLKQISVKKGISINRGDLVGLLGNTGRSTGPHLHYEVRFKGKTVNPIKFMKVAKEVVALSQ